MFMAAVPLLQTQLQVPSTVEAEVPILLAGVRMRIRKYQTLRCSVTSLGKMIAFFAPYFSVQTYC